MSRATHEAVKFWGGVGVRLAGIFVAGLALIVFFQDVMRPILQGDVERLQKEQFPAESLGTAELTPDASSSAVQK